MVKETDFGKELDKVVENFMVTYGGEFVRASEDVWNILLTRRRTNEADDKIKMVHKGAGISAYGVLYRRFTDVSGKRFRRGGEDAHAS